MATPNQFKRLSLFLGYERSRLQFRLARLFTNANLLLHLAAFAISPSLLLLEYHAELLDYALGRLIDVQNFEKDKVSAFTIFRLKQLV